jgi:hypothetical protein
MEFIVLFLVLSLLVSVYVSYNLYMKYQKLEEISIENSRIMSQRSYLKQLDRRGAFESDDEIGFFFKELKKIVDDISKNFEMEEEEIDQDQTEEQTTNPFITSRF